MGGEYFLKISFSSLHSHGLEVMMFEDVEEKGHRKIGDKVVCITAQVSPGLLEIGAVWKNSYSLAFPVYQRVYPSVICVQIMPNP